MKRIILDGEIKAITPNEYEGITVKIKNVHGDGKSSNAEFVYVFGNYAKALVDKKVIAVGDAIVVDYEEKTIAKANAETGETEWKERMVGVHFSRTLRPSTSSAPQDAPVELSSNDQALDRETF